MWWWMESRWISAFGTQRDKRTMTDSAPCPTHRRYFKLFGSVVDDIWPIEPGKTIMYSPHLLTQATIVFLSLSLTRMCFLSVFHSWVLPRLKTSVPRWVDEVAGEVKVVLLLLSPCCHPDGKLINSWSHRASWCRASPSWEKACV